MSSCDHGPTVCIVGGGPAGLATAIALRREDSHVTVVDCRVPPIDKACGEGLLPDGISALRELGIEIPDDVGFPFRGVRFADGRSSVCANFSTGTARGVRRTVLHELLIRHAVRQGVSIMWGAKQVRLANTGVTVNGRLIAADLVVGADGQNSNVRRQASLDRVLHETRRYGFRRHFRVAPLSSYMEVHWGPRSQIYVTPVARDEICVAVISRDSNLRLNQALGEFPELHERLRNAEPVGRELGGLSVSRRLHRVHSKNVVLVGDASGSVDAITGEGICLGAKQARALAVALKSGNVGAYQQLHRALMKRPQAMGSLMLMLERNGRLRQRVLAGLAQHPKIFESLLAFHVGASWLPPKRIIIVSPTSWLLTTRHIDF
jgi:menaquinone-9 beta-reductase